MAPIAFRVEDLFTCLITLKYLDRQILLLNLARDGSINRAGDGTASGNASTLFIGVTEEPLFDEFLQAVNPEVLQMGGRYEVVDRKGGDSELRLVFGSDSGIVEFEFLYGAESEGPPEEIVAILRKAIELTDPWWRKQLAAAT